MSWHWLTDGIPWRFIVIRRTYIRNIRIAHACPEIAGEINRNAFWLMVGIWFYTPVFLILLPFIAMRAIGLFGEWVCNFPVPLPDFEGKRIQSVRDANAKISVEEVQRRLGMGEARVLKKKHSA